MIVSTTSLVVASGQLLAVVMRVEDAVERVLHVLSGALLNVWHMVTLGLISCLINGRKGQRLHRIDIAPRVRVWRHAFIVAFVKYVCNIL